MRIMDDLINDYDLQDEVEERVVEETGNTGFWLGYDSEGLDESSDKEDPEKTLPRYRRQESLLRSSVKYTYAATNDE